MFQKSRVCSAVLLALSGASVLMAPGAFAQTEQRIEVTGSAIKRSISDEGALPLTVHEAPKTCASRVSRRSSRPSQQLTFSQSSSVGSNSIGSGHRRRHLRQPARHGHVTRPWCC